MIEARGGIEALESNWRLELVAFLYVSHSLIVTIYLSFSRYSICLAFQPPGLAEET